ncbi:protein trichome birefringence-like [Asimina triloba]
MHSKQKNKKKSSGYAVGERGRVRQKEENDTTHLLRRRPSGRGPHLFDCLSRSSSLFSHLVSGHLRQREREMVKETRLDFNTLLHHKHSHILVKLAVSVLLVGLSFRLFFSESFSFSPVSNRPPLRVADTPLPGAALQAEKRQEPPNGNGERCDIFKGEWVPNPSGPIYDNESCPIVEGHQNCMKNGRPDSGYLYWRWKPRDCELPPFDSLTFLEAMRNKHWAFVGDSISRNHVQSLLCTLSKAFLPLPFFPLLLFEDEMDFTMGIGGFRSFSVYLTWGELQIVHKMVNAKDWREKHRNPSGLVQPLSFTNPLAIIGDMMKSLSLALSAVVNKI